MKFLPSFGCEAVASDEGNVFIGSSLAEVGVKPFGNLTDEDVAVVEEIGDREVACAMEVLLEVKDEIDVVEEDEKEVTVPVVVTEPPFLSPT